MANLNKVFLVGNVTRDPEVRYTPTGTAVTDLGLAVNETYKNKAGELVVALAQYDSGVGFDGAGGTTYRGDLELVKGNAAAAIREYRQAELQLPKSSELEVKLARAYLTAGRITEGVEVLQRAVQINPRSFEGYWLLTQIYRQKAAQSFGAEKADNEKLAAEAQAKTSELNPNHPEVIVWKREDAEARDPLAAIADREKRRANDPENMTNLQRLAELYVRAWRQESAGLSDDARQSLIQQADGFFQTVLAATSDDMQLTLARSAAEFYALSKQTDVGRTALQDLIAQRQGESRIEPQVLLAMFYEALGSADAAEREYVQAQRLVREVAADAEERRRLDLGVGMSIIRFQQRQRRQDKVAEGCRWLLDRLGTEADQAGSARQVRLTLVEALFNAGQAADAEAEVNDFLKLYPGDPQGLSARAQLALRRRDRARALEDLEQVLQQDPDDVLSLYSRGRLALEAGRYDKAREDLARAEGLLPRRPRLEPEVRRQLASLYLRRGEYDLAATQFRMLLDVLEKEEGQDEQKQHVMRQLGRLLYGAMDQFDTAQRLISGYMEKHPTEALWPYELGRLFEARAANAERDARKARERGDTTVEQERREAARQSYGSAAMYYQRAGERAGDKNSRDRAASLIAQMAALTSGGRGAEAMEIFRKIDFARLPADMRGEAQTRLGMEAAKALQEAAKLSITLAGEIAGGLREAFAQEPAAAEALLRHAAEGIPPDDLAAARLRLVLAAHLSVGGNGAAVLSLVAETLPKLGAGTPERLSALITRARAQELTGDVEGAVRTYKEVLAE
ncbi:MAG: tetratricopeptide repeat protein, partial [Verrucomicrobia bacterium]|nr:tetratricopeptide repeat protein [Verrucomicrobiota bacterium]